jgi:2'-5' RNA ligase
MSRQSSETKARLFVAADLPLEVIEAIAAWQSTEITRHDELRAARTVHLTFCFLGDVARSRIDDITAALSGIDVPPLPAALGEVLFLPERGRKRVVALGLNDPSGAIASVQREASRVLSALKVHTAERRAWLPHVTVARYRRPGREVPLQNVNFQEFGLPQLTLYDSILARGGAVHTPLASFAAGQPERPGR